VIVCLLLPGEALLGAGDGNPRTTADFGLGAKTAENEVMQGLADSYAFWVLVFLALAVVYLPRRGPDGARLAGQSDRGADRDRVGGRHDSRLRAATASARACVAAEWGCGGDVA
jgi:hypothetical protein